MILNLRSILKLILFIILLVISGTFFYKGYIILNKFTLITGENQSKIVEKNELNENDLITNQFFIESEDTKESIKTNTKERIIIVKKNDTFSKILNPYIDDSNIKNNIIKLISKEYDLNTLNIGQKIYFYLNNDEGKNKLYKIIIPLSFNTDLVLKKYNSTSEYFISKEIPSFINKGLPYTIILKY